MSDAPRSKLRPIRHRVTRISVDKTWTQYPNPPTSRDAQFDDGVETLAADVVAERAARRFQIVLDEHEHLAEAMHRKCVECGRPCRVKYCMKCRSKPGQWKRYGKKYAEKRKDGGG